MDENNTAKFTKLLVGTILRNPSGFKWQVQGLGMMRVYLSEEVRLHIWDSSLKVPGVSAIHSHPWDLESHVVAGVYRQRRYTCPADNQLSYAREFNDVMIKCGAEACTKSDPVKVRLIEGYEENYPAGSFYFQSKDEIHLSHADDGTVTIVKRTFQEDRDSARVLWPGSGPWIDAKPRPAADIEIANVTARSLEYWF